MNTSRERLILVLPLALLLLVLLIGPAAFGLFAAFTDYGPAQPVVHWTGLANFEAVLGDSEFVTGLKNVALFLLVAVPAELLLGLAIALLLRRPFPGRGLLRILMLVPWLVSPAGNGIMWHFLYDSHRGLPSYLVAWLGAPGLASPLGLPDFALPAAIVTDIWRQAPFAAFLLLPGLLSIPGDEWEQAELAGASLLERVRFIVVSRLRPLLLTVGLLLVGGTLGSFDNILVLTGGGPGSRTTMPGLYSYRQAITLNDWPSGAASAWIIGLFMVLVGAVYVRLVTERRKESAPADLAGPGPLHSQAAAQIARSDGLTPARPARDLLGWRTVRRLSSAARGMALALVLVIFIVPLIWTALASFNIQPLNTISPPVWESHPSGDNYTEVGTTEPGFTDELKTSVLLTAMTTLVTMGVAFLAAYALARSAFRGRAALVSSMLVLSSLPAMAYIVPESGLLKAAGLYDTMAGVALGEAAALAPLAVFVLYGYLVQISPEYEEAARLEGTGIVRTLGTIVLPLAASGVAATAVVVFVLAWNQALIPLILSTNHARTVPLAMLDFFKFDRELEWPSVAAAFVSSLLPLLVLAVAAFPLLERFNLTPAGSD